MDDSTHPVPPNETATPPHGDPLRDASAAPPPLATPGVPQTGTSEPVEGTVPSPPVPGTPPTGDDSLAR